MAVVQLPVDWRRRARRYRYTGRPSYAYQNGSSEDRFQLRCSNPLLSVRYLATRSGRSALRLGLELTDRRRTHSAWVIAGLESMTAALAAAFPRLRPGSVAQSRTGLGGTEFSGSFEHGSTIRLGTSPQSTRSGDGDFTLR